MASGRLRLNRPGSQLQPPPAKSVCISDERALLPPIETTSHWILNDRLVVQQQQQQAGGHPACISQLGCTVDEKVLVIDISSSEEDNGASDCSFVSQGECATGQYVIENCDPPVDGSGVVLDSKSGQHAPAPVPVPVGARVVDDGDEQIYTFGEEEEFLSQAAVARWRKDARSQDQEGHDDDSILDDTYGTYSPLLAFLTLHNLDTLLPTLLAHEVVSIGCMCILTSNDIACAALLPSLHSSHHALRPSLSAAKCQIPSHSSRSALGITSEAARLRLMAAIVALRKHVLVHAVDRPSSSKPLPLPAAVANAHPSRDLPYLQLQTQPGGTVPQQRDISSFFRTPAASSSSDETHEYANESKSFFHRDQVTRVHVRQSFRQLA